MPDPHVHSSRSEKQQLRESGVYDAKFALTLGIDPATLEPPIGEELSAIRRSLAAIKNLLRDAVPKEHLSMEEGAFMNSQTQELTPLQLVHETRVLRELFCRKRSELDAERLTAADQDALRAAGEKIEVIGEYLAKASVGRSGGLNCCAESYPLLLAAIGSLESEVSAMRPSIKESLSKFPVPRNEEPAEITEQLSFPALETEERLRALSEDLEKGEAGKQSEAEDEAVKHGEAASQEGKLFADIEPESGAGLRDRLAGSIQTVNQELFQHMAVSSVFVVTGTNGEMTELSCFIEEQRTRGVPAAARLPDSELYEHKLVPALSLLKARSREEADCEIPVSDLPVVRGGPVVPVSSHFDVVALSYLDLDGKELNFQAKVVQGKFGSCRVEAPPGAAVTVRFRLAPAKARPISPALLSALEELLPAFRVLAADPIVNYLSEADSGGLDSLNKAKLCFDADVARGQYYTGDPLVARYVNSSGTARLEALEGLGMGTCNAFAYLAANKFNLIGSPSIVLNGLVPDARNKRFIVSPWHAQTGLLTPDGVAVFDMTLSVARDKKVNGKLVPEGEWARAFEDLQSTTRRRVYEFTSELRPRILEDAPTKDGVERVGDDDFSGAEREAAWEGEGAAGSGNESVLDALRDLLQLALPVPRGDERAPLSRLSHDFKETPQMRAWSRGLKVLDQYRRLSGAIQRGMSSGSLREACLVFEKLDRCVFLSPADLKHLPEKFRVLKEFSAKEMLHTAIQRALASDSFALSGKTEVLGWVIGRITSPGRFDITDGDASRQFMLASLDPKLEPSEALPFLSEKNLRFASTQDLIAGAHALLRTVARSYRCSASNRAWGHFTVYCGTLERTRNLLDASLAVSAELRRRQEAIPDDRAAEMLTFLSVSGYAFAEGRFYDHDTKAELPSSRILEIFGLIGQNFQAFNGAGVKGPCSGLLEMLKRCSDQYSLMLQRTVKRGLAEGCISWGTDEAAKDQQDRHVSALVASHIEQHVGTGWNYARIIGNLETLGFKVDLASRRAAIQRACEIATPVFTQVAGYERVNFPGPAAPASTIVCAIADTPVCRFYRSLRCISEHSGLDLESVGKFWPPMSEESVASAVGAHINVDSSRQQAWTWLTYREEDRVPEQVFLQDIGCLAEEGLKERPRALSIMRTLREEGAFTHPLEPAFQALKDSYPGAWRGLVLNVFDRYRYKRWDTNFPEDATRDALSVGVLKKLLVPLAPMQMYHGLLALAEARVRGGQRDDLKWDEQVAQGKEMDSPLLRLADVLLDSPRAWASETALAEIITAHAPARLLEAHYFARLAPREQASAVLAFGIEEEILGISADRVFDALKLTPHLYETSTAQRYENGRHPLAAVWAGFFGVSYTHDREVAAYLSEVRGNIGQLVRTDGRQMKSSYSSFLFHQSGRRSPLSPSGEYEDHVAYQPGMDPRQIDWKVYGKTDRFYLIRRRERELRPLMMLVDMEWLVQGYEEYPDYSYEARNRGKSLKLHPHLRQLVQNFLVANAEGLAFQLVLAARGHVVESYSRDEMRRNLSHTWIDDEKSSYEPRFTDERFLKDLLLMCGNANHTVKVEEHVFGSAGFEGTGILSGSRIEVPAQAIVVAAVHKKNIEASLPGLNAIDGSRGRTVHLLADING